jgi:hypothetical protein
VAEEVSNFSHQQALKNCLLQNSPSMPSTSAIPEFYWAAAHAVLDNLSVCTRGSMSNVSHFRLSFSLSLFLSYSWPVHFWHDAREGSSTNIDGGQWSHWHPGAAPIRSGPFSAKRGWLALCNLLANPCRHAPRVASIALLSLLCRSEAATSCRPNPVLWTDKDLQATEMKSEFKRTEISLENQNWS